MTDPRWPDARLVEVVRAIARPEVVVQLRDRTERSDESLLPLAEALREATARGGAKLVVNRRLALARRVSADGLHAPAGELHRAASFAWRSAPSHDDDEVRAALAAGATAVLVSPIFATPDKAPPRGVRALRAARALAPRATLVALGGVDASNATECYEAGATGVAVVRALLDAPDPAGVASALLVRSRA